VQIVSVVSIEGSFVKHPVYLSTFVGRRKELGEIKALLRERSVRLLTLTGPGGCGKTRLAFEALSEISQTFEDGAVWVDLVGLSDPAALIQEIATRLSVRPASGQTVLAALIATLQQRETLLILDNCEHVWEASALLADTLLRACPELHLLATSRQRLRVEGEQVWPVPPLSYPINDAPTFNALVNYDALQLFQARARLVQPKFEANAHNVHALVKIAQLLEGMPLAIELAAARVNELDVSQMANRIENQVLFLAGKGHTSASRHQSIRETIHWSFELLTVAERALFCRLGVFSGGFSLDAAEAVCSDTPLEEGQILDLLGILIDKSLVIQESSGQLDSRYRQLESIRQFAAETLRASQEENLMRDRHLAYFADLIRTAEPHLLGPDQKVWSDRLETDYDNLHAALSWSIQKAIKDERFTLEAVRMANGLYWFWNYSGRHEEARDWFAKILTLPGLDRNSSVYADLKHHLATFIWLLGNYPEAQKQLHECQQSAEAAVYPYRLGYAKLMLGIMSLHQGQMEHAAALLRESEKLFSALGEPRGLVITYTNLGGVFQAAGDLDTAQEYAEKAVHHARASQDLWGLGLSLSGLSDVLYRQGEVKRAFVLIEEALELIRSSGQPWLQAEALWRLADMMQDQGDWEAASKRLEECYDLAQENGAVEWQLSALTSLGFLCLSHGNSRQAAGHFSEVLRLQIGQGYERILVHALLGVIQLAVVSEQSGQALALWRAYKNLRATHGLSPFKEESLTAQLLQPYFESSARSQTQPPRRDYSQTEATGLAMEIVEGFEQRVVVLRPQNRLQILGLGTAEVYLNGKMLVASDWTFAKPKELLYYLASNAPKTKEQIGMAFWPDASPSQLRVSLRATLYHLRRALGERGWVLYEDGYYQFNRSLDYWYDVEAFEEGIEAAEKQPVSDMDRAIERLEASVLLYRGDFLSDLASDEWAALRREELRGKYFGAMSTLGELLIDKGAYDRAIELYRNLLAKDALLEDAHRALIRCYALKGERGLAIRQYQTLVRILQDELGVSPSPETVALFQSLDQDAL
jgi:predicted ATPase/DNA-binding SARP family transcriptional activator/Tfp pilus assembly protein PilF